MRTHNRKGPSGERYHFTNPVDGEPTEVPVYSFEDARHFERQDDTFDTSWTAQGRVARMVGDSVSDAASVLKELSYRQKQRLTSSLNLEVKGNAPEDELDEALQPAVEEMTEQIDNTR
jgi:hypothetical protein